MLAFFHHYIIVAFYPQKKLSYLLNNQSHTLYNMTLERKSLYRTQGLYSKTMGCMQVTFRQLNAGKNLTFTKATPNACSFNPAHSMRQLFC